MNEIAHYLDEIDDCIWCGKPCTEYDNDGNPIHDECVADREATRIDQAYERGREPK